MSVDKQTAKLLVLEQKVEILEAEVITLKALVSGLSDRLLAQGDLALRASKQTGRIIKILEDAQQRGKL